MTIRVITTGMKQDATLWRVTPDGYGGDTFAAPVLLKVRWEERAEDYIGPIDRREYISKSIIFMSVDASLGDWLALGDQTAIANPSLAPASAKIQRFDKITDLRNVSILRKAIL